MRIKFPAKRQEPRRTERRTAVSFTAKDLDDLARLLGAGQVMLRQSFPVMSRLKAAMTKLGVSTKGL